MGNDICLGVSFKSDYFDFFLGSSVIKTGQNRASNGSDVITH